MPTRGALSDNGRKWRDYAWYLVRRQSGRSTAFLGIVAGVLVYKLSGLPSAEQLSTFVVTGVVALVGAVEAWEHWQRFRFAERAEIRRTCTVDVGGSTQVHLDHLQPSRRQRALGFGTAYAGADRIIASDALDRALLERDWRVEPDTGKPQRVRALVRQHREHALAFLAALMARTRTTGALLINEDKLCLDDELENDHVVRCHRGNYFDSLCTNEASTAVLEQGGRQSRPFHGRTLYPLARDVDGYYLEDLNEADVDNHIGVSTLAITRDRHFVIWQQSDRNLQSPGTIISTGSGSCDYADLQPASLLRTVCGAMERELREECSKRSGLPRGAAPDGLVQTRVIGFFRWLQRGGKPEFIGVSRLALNVADMRPDGFEVGAIIGRTATGEQVKLQNCFAVPSLDDVVPAIQDIRRLLAGGGGIEPLPMSLPLRRILDVLEELHRSNPHALDDILYGPAAQRAPAVPALQ